ncbi:VacJ family lipoprotein [Stutzerimonas nosocomialis]|uniref:VacJ family lipoprotein n=1 Tax=Stutzerimonas nosocomialis TaxID=1056496 RepID=A0A5R9QJG1_9GAMM|nr:VacJ family lipoprotein [Stutzerimonas nosocomialis]TLX56507.1 VacJ family lipoprotein [Stutzerimonas nosocomialis]TLX58270.1 VacJ family lipoprotein [Stutzerimonas nosocomialis]TLX65112.1 VacJ family lipoprotein [Stutzerimonas nosocomialis]
MTKTGAGWAGYIKAALFLSFAATGSSLQAAEEDPWEGVNRAVFAFNDTVDTYTLKPLARGYQAVTPQFLEDGIGNVFSNLGDVVVLTNNLLQGKVRDAGVDTSRILFNTTFGVLGFFDVASRMGLQKNDEDFGQTLGAWGLGSGPYVVLPLLGPSSVRDTFGRVPDSFLQPYPYIDHVPTRNVTLAVNTVDTRAGLLQTERMIQGDRYIFVRNAYLQNREFRVNDGVVEDDF